MSKIKEVKDKKASKSIFRKNLRLAYRFSLLATGIMGMMLPTGCQSGHGKVSKVQDFLGPSYRPQNFYSVGAMPEEIHRVVYLPVYYDEYEGDFLEAIDHDFVSALTQTSLFEVVVVSRKELLDLLGRRQLTSVERLPIELFEYLEQKYAADAVLFTDLTQYSPYKPIDIGIRSKLIAMESKDILWAFDEVFSSGNPSVSVSARRFQRSSDLSTQPLQTAETILRSPRQFSRYIAFEVFGTIPGR